MKIYPAIDLYNGQAVRLVKGKLERIKYYGNALDIAKRFSEYTNNLHIVDLNGAFEGSPKNLDIVEEIIEKTKMNIQIGGGLRSMEVIKRAFDIGAKNIIISSKITDFNFLEKLCDKFPITISLDFLDGNIMTKGWTVKSKLNFYDAINTYTKYTNRFIYTDISKDGVLQGISKIPLIENNIEMIYAGGVTYISDIEEIKNKGFNGVIIGKALYENKISLELIKELV